MDQWHPVSPKEEKNDSTREVVIHDHQFHHTREKARLSRVVYDKRSEYKKGDQCVNKGGIVFVPFHANQHFQGLS